MEKIKKNKRKNLKPIKTDFFDHFWEKSWTYIKTVVDVVREPVLILDKDFQVMTANESFYKTFKVEKKDTENKVVYKLGNGQWDIPALRNLLEDILPKHTFFNGFEVSHKFPSIGDKTMILNARQIYFKEGTTSKTFPTPIILLAMEDVTEMMSVAKKLADHTNQFEAKIEERTKQMEMQISVLKKEIDELQINSKSK